MAKTKTKKQVVEVELEPRFPAKAGSVEDAAAAMGIGINTLYLLIEQGHIKPVRIGRKMVISAAEIDRFLADNAGKRLATAI